MRPIALIAVREFTDAGGSYVRGEYLERPPLAAVLLLNHRHVRLAKRGEKPIVVNFHIDGRQIAQAVADALDAIPDHINRHEADSESPAVVDEEMATPRRRTYRRRDLTAEQP